MQTFTVVATPTGMGPTVQYLNIQDIKLDMSGNDFVLTDKDNQVNTIPALSNQLTVSKV
jgi:hypothetical protein